LVNPTVLLKKIISALTITLLFLTALGAGVFTRLQITPKSAIQTNSAPEALSIQSAQQATKNPSSSSVTIDSNITLAFGEASAWLESLNLATRDYLREAERVTLLLYKNSPSSRSEYLNHERCANHLIHQSINLLSAKEITALQSKPLASQLLMTTNLNEEDARIALTSSLAQSIIMPATANVIGAEEIARINRIIGRTTWQTNIAEFSACKAIGIANKFK